MTTGESGSRLEQVLRSGTFSVTAELETTDSANPDSIREVAEPLLGHVDGINCTDNSAAHPHISQTAAARLLIDLGQEPIMQQACRDRNRLALQADLLGAAALGVRNFTMMTGDDVSAGDHPEAKPMYDLDSIHLLRTATVMRDEGTYLSGRKLDDPPKFFLGAVENPFAPPHDFRPIRMGKKIEAGAQFIQTQLVYNIPRMREFMSKATDLGLLEKVFVLASIGVPRSARGIHYMAEQVPGIDVPAEYLNRMDKAGKERGAEEGVQIGLELVEAMRDTPGIAGVHLICIKSPATISRVIKEAGLLPRPDFAP